MRDRAQPPFTPAAAALATIIEAISDLIFAAACLPASAISVIVFFSTSSALSRAFLTISLGLGTGFGDDLRRLVLSLPDQTVGFGTAFLQPLVVELLVSS